jgi:pimeloyl-ACP methyl ester carboxylesterase
VHNIAIQVPWTVRIRGGYGLPITEVILKEDSIVINADLIKGIALGVVAEQERMSGAWHQPTFDMNFSLNKTTGKTYRAYRPQHPLPPFPYRVQEVAYQSDDKQVKFGGTLTLPAKGDKFPAVILISGSGPQDRDRRIFDHKPFMVIADYLTRQGIAVLRVDDRGVRATKGNATNATSADFANDVLAGIHFLKTNKEINPLKIGLIGHSEGGIVAPMVAGKSKDVAFIVLLAAPGLAGREVLIEQNKAMFLTAGADSLSVAVYMKLFEKVLDDCLQLSDSMAISTTTKKHLVEWQQSSPPEVVKQLGMQDAKAANTITGSLVKSFSQPWMKYFLTYDPAPALTQIKCPVLALNGSKDLQVIAAPNLAAIKKHLQEGGNKNFKTMELSGLNHLFQTANTGNLQEYGIITETFAPQALEVIGKWILERKK